jgi:hypothetical protein
MEPAVVDPGARRHPRRRLIFRVAMPNADAGIIAGFSTGNGLCRNDA